MPAEDPERIVADGADRVADAYTLETQAVRTAERQTYTRILPPRASELDFVVGRASQSPHASLLRTFVTAPAGEITPTVASWLAVIDMGEK